MAHRHELQEHFRLFIALSAVILILEVAGGVITNSLALLSDAGHVLTDLLAMLLAYGSIRLSQRRPTERFSFGYYRFEIFSALINGFALIFITLYIFYEAYQRFLDPQPVRGAEMLVFAVIGFIVNLYVVLRMHGDEAENLNVRGAYLHVLSDTLASVGVIAAAVLIAMTGVTLFDPVISIVIGFFILGSSVNLIRESLYILLEATPRRIDVADVIKTIESVDGVREAHDLHIWGISSDVYSLNVHILIDTADADKLNRILADVNAAVKERHHIDHTVIQTECDSCAVDDP